MRRILAVASVFCALCCMSLSAWAEESQEGAERGAAVSSDGGGEAGIDGKILNYINDHFRFGSYGRVQPSINPVTSGSGRNVQLVYPSPRATEQSYLEMTLGYTPYRGEDGTVVDMVATLAVDGALFHYTGDFDAQIALRDLYVEARNLWVEGLVVWAGSRMYRGDDIYLLDFWPLDNLNTYGGGFGWHGSTRTNVDFHMGVNRLNDEYQYQVVDYVNERFVGKTEVVFLDRQRLIASLKVEQLFGGKEKEMPLMKLKAYGEVHHLGEGELLLTQPEYIESLPADNGWLLGLEFGLSEFLNDSFVNFFIRYSSGLAAYGESAIPFGFADDKTASAASQFLMGVGGAIETKYLGILFGGFVRYFKDADGKDIDFEDGWEGVWDIRFVGFATKYFTPMIELSQQLRKPNGLNPVTQSQDLGSVFKLSIMPAITFGDGLLSRPQFRLNYTVSFLNDAARYMFPEKDPLRSSGIEHYIGFAAEWWFNR